MKFVFPLLMTAVGWVIFGCQPTQRPSLKPIKKDIVFAIFASGKLNPKHTYNVVPRVTGYVSRVLVEVGQLVKAGQPLITIYSETNEKNLEIAKNQLLLAQKNLSPQSPPLNSARQELETARLKYELDSSNFERYKILLSQNVITAQQYEQLQTQLEIAKRNYQKSLYALQQIENQVQTEYRNAKLLLESQQSNLNEFTIFSAINGKIYDVMIQEGELVNMNTPLMLIGDIEYFEADLYVEEKDISFVKPEQKVVYEIEAYRGKFFQGQVQKIYPRINPSNKTCKVIASLEKNPEIQLYAGMSLEANIIVEEKRQALVIPKSFLLDNQKVIRKIPKDTVVISKGIEDLEYVEILGGIDENTEILKP